MLGSLFDTQLAQQIGGIQRILVPYNIKALPKRKAALANALNNATAANRHVIITFEVGCTEDKYETSCNNATTSKKDTVPSPEAVNNAAIAIKKLKWNGTRVGGVVRYFSVWDEPANDNQPFRPVSSSSDRAARKGGGLEGLKRPTLELAGKNKTKRVCSMYTCDIISAEVEIISKSGLTRVPALKKR
ncbi:MAG: hypothetical protein PGN13_13700 [Patulibacter minatonensis]